VSITDAVVSASTTITARGALIYNSTQANKAIAVFDFGADKIFYCWWLYNSVPGCGCCDGDYPHQIFVGLTHGTGS
jgi:hypothetical protein